MSLSDFAFLSDENIHPAVAAFLRERGMDVVTVFDVGMAGGADALILETAFRADRIVLTHDADFGSLAVAAGKPVFGIVYLRPGHIQAAFTIRTLQAMIDAHLDLKAPFILVATQGQGKVRVRIRSL